MCVGAGESSEGPTVQTAEQGYLAPNAAHMVVPQSLFFFSLVLPLFLLLLLIQCRVALVRWSSTASVLY